MSGRGTTVFPWSLSGNFPAGAFAWSSQPLAVMPAGTYFTPNTIPAAENLNWLFGTISTDLQGLQDWVGNDSAINWGAPVAASAFASQTEIGAARWAPKAHQWLLGTGNHGTPSVQAWLGNGSADDGVADFTALGTSITPSTSGHITAMSESPTNAGEYWMVIADDSNQQKIWKYPAGGPWASNHTNNTAAFGNSDMVAGTGLGGNVIVVATAQAAGGIITHTGNGGTTWADFATGVEVDKFYIGWNGSIFVAISSNLTVTNANYWTSPDGANWTARVFPSGMNVTAGHAVPVGLAWDGSNWRILLNESVADGGGIAIATAPDGLTWTAAAIIGGPTTPVMADLAAIGNLLVATTQDAAAGPSQLYYAFDGGVTWYPVLAPFASNVATTQHYYQRTRVWASNQGYIATNTNLLRESLLQGVPTTHL